MNEAAHASPLGTTLFDSMLGLAIRRHCAPVLDLEPLAPADDYLERRAELGAAEVNRRFLAAAGIDTYLVDTGLGNVGPGDGVICAPDELAALAGGTAREVVRLEHLAEQVLAAGTSDFAGDVIERLRSAKARRRRRGQVDRGVPRRPRAARRQARRRPTSTGPSPGSSPVRVTSMRVSAWLAHTALEIGLPLQVHVGVRRQRPRPARLRPAAADGLPAGDRGARRARAAPAQLPVPPQRRLPRPGLRPRLPRPRPRHAQHGRAVGGALPRDARARAVRQAAVLHRRLRPRRALPPRHAALPVRSGRGPRRPRRCRRADRRRRGVRRAPGRGRQRPPGLRALGRPRQPAAARTRRTST